VAGVCVNLVDVVMSEPVQDLDLPIREEHGRTTLLDCSRETNVRLKLSSGSS